MGIFLLILFAIVSVLLVLMVIIQNESGDSIGGIFAGSSDTAFGSRSSSVIVKITYGLGAAFLVLVFSLAFVYKTASPEGAQKAADKSIEGKGHDWFSTSATGGESALPSGLTTDLEAPADVVAPNP